MCVCGPGADGGPLSASGATSQSAAAAGADWSRVGSVGGVSLGLGLFFSNTTTFVLRNVSPPRAQLARPLAHSVSLARVLAPNSLISAASPPFTSTFCIFFCFERPSANTQPANTQPCVCVCVFEDEIKS